MTRWEYCVVKPILLGRLQDDQDDDYEIEGSIWELYEPGSGKREPVVAPDEFLHQLGDDGWELVNVVVDGWQEFRYANAEDNERLLANGKALIYEMGQPWPKYYFKRPINEPEQKKVVG